MAQKVPTPENLLLRSTRNRAETTPVDHRSHLALELIADTLIALLAELQRPGDSPVTRIS
jgi:hypothetical protein